MPLTAQNKVGKSFPNGDDPIYSGHWMLGNRPVPTLIASAGLGGDGTQQFSVPGANWVINGWSGGTVARNAGYIALNNPAPGAGGVFSLAGIECSALALRDVYMQFSARFPGVIHGSKFCKMHGAVGSNGFGANCTFGQNDAGDNNYIGYGDGVALGQDVNQAINLGSAITSGNLGRNNGIAEVVVQPLSAFTAAQWGNSWHNFKVHAKFNTGTSAQDEVPDGEFYLEIDGTVYCHVRHIFNRHYLNPPLAEINLGGWTANGSQAFELDFKDIKISTGGFV